MRLIFSLLLSLFVGVSQPAVAGAGDEMVAADDFRFELNIINMHEAEQYVGNPDVLFYDVNTLELWSEGFIPNAIHFFVEDWERLLPEDKNKLMIFYCANRLCNASELAAYAVMKKGYTNVRQMPDGIFGWRMSGRQVELP
ncbi:rhodanese-like domain-containing protein [Ferrimonas senticii]|uniref:rhodanese-like domain-containing protein n=1 Tax=Ferrimonas senticii TaxID=394566 RepID=UPI0004060695|nr:rhodanese-like domain-containing protein [Ferrimonas senticii]